MSCFELENFSSDINAFDKMRLFFLRIDVFGYSLVFAERIGHGF